MEQQQFNVLILEDNERSFDVIKEFITENKDFADNNLLLQIYDKEKSQSILADFIAYKRVPAQYTAEFKNRFERKFKSIMDGFEDKSLICIIDINWDGNKGQGEKLEDGDDWSGLDFYKEYLAQRRDKLKDIIITTVGKIRPKLKVALVGFNHIILKNDGGYFSEKVKQNYITEFKKIVGITISKKNINGISEQEAGII